MILPVFHNTGVIHSSAIPGVLPKKGISCSRFAIKRKIVRWWIGSSRIRLFARNRKFLGRKRMFGVWKSFGKQRILSIFGRVMKCKRAITETPVISKFLSTGNTPQLRFPLLCHIPEIEELQELSITGNRRILSGKSTNNKLNSVCANSNGCSTSIIGICRTEKFLQTRQTAVQFWDSGNIPVKLVGFNRGGMTRK